MRVSTRLRVIAAATLAALVLLAPLLIGGLRDFRRAKSDAALADQIRTTFFETESSRDQYLLYREDRLERQWRHANDASLALLVQADGQFSNAQDRVILRRLRVNTEERSAIFQRLVANSTVLKTDQGKLATYQELDDRLVSQQMLRAVDFREMADALEQACAQRAEQNWQELTLEVGGFGLLLALATVLTALQVSRLVRAGLAPLHQGAKALAGGDLAYRIAAPGGDEFAELAHAFNSMANQLQAANDQLGAELGARQRAQAELQEALSRLMKIGSRVPGIAIIQFRRRRDGSFCLPYASDGFSDIFRVSADQLRDDAAAAFAAVHPDDLPQLQASLARSATELSPWQHEYRLRFAGEPDVFLSANALPQPDADGAVLWCGFVFDITERKQAEEQVQLAASVFIHAREGIMITDTAGSIINTNDAFSYITGYSREEVLGRKPHVLSSGRHDHAFYDQLWHDLLSKGHWYGEIWNRRKSGEVYAVMENISAVRDAQGSTRHYVALFTDITSLKLHEQQLEHLAHYDPLTGLPNRVLLADRLHQGLALAQRHAQMLAVAYLDPALSR